MSSVGVLVALDEKLEWLLPWWWTRFSSCNSLPVAFVDLGMSSFGLSFCREKGEVISLETSPSLARAPEHAAEWEALFGEGLWENRKSWFQKPFAFLSTPFKRTLWLDLDCEVLQPLDSLFTLERGMHIAVETEPSLKRERELGTIYKDETLYNSGVILFDQEEPLLEKWAVAVSEAGDHFWSDQHALSRVIYEEKREVHHLHENYNWRMSQGLNIHAAIIHWVGSWGKEYIKQHGGLAGDLANLPKI